MRKKVTNFQPLDVSMLLMSLVTAFFFCIACSSNAQQSASQGTSTPTKNPVLPGQQLWKNGVSSYLFGTNDSVDYSNDNFVTDPRHIIQSSLKSAHFQIMREFIFHYSIIDGHRTTLGTNPQIQLDPNNPHEYDTPAAQQTTATPNAPYGYELETLSLIHI